MTTLNRQMPNDIQQMIEKARPDQLERLLADIMKADSWPSPTHPSTTKIQ